ncbi:MAG TPA: DNA translocase FtsK 4TM domain-containing protein [Coriobacteriia bacterium]|nr:DNA translocase FtsK 4TM domain-containing protein [Coriobacteriia bacterium]
MGARKTKQAPQTRRATPARASAQRAGGPAGRQVLDARSRQDIWGIVLVAAAVTLAIALLAARTGVLGEAIATVFRQLFGAGALAVPIFLLVWGITFFVKAFEISEARMGAGLGALLLALVGILALSAPLAGQWDSAIVESYGGYAGAGIAWLLRSAFGVTIAYVLLVALALISCVVAGLSVSGLLSRVGARVKGVADSPPEPAARHRDRSTRTVPLTEYEPGRPVPGSPHRARPTRKVDEDPERRRPTEPAPRATAPKAMEGFELPSPSLLARSVESATRHRTTERELTSTARLIEETLATFDIPSTVVGWIPGPTVTMYEIELVRGIKVSSVTRLADDLALALAAATVRILAPIPGKSLVGIEVPNERRSTVTLGDVLSAPSAARGGPLLLGIGKDVAGDSVLADLAAMPHLLIAGSTGAGKSVCINALLTTVLMRATPAEVRLILIDPKRIELSIYNEIPHLYVPVVTEAKEAASALAWAVSEMESRLKRLQKAGAKNIGAYNALVQDAKAPEGAEEMPYLMIVIDELADLMMVAAKEVEDSICRLAQLARAAGIHLVVATQRPSTDIITGLIKTNITNRIAFAVSSSIDSRVILDQPGAEKLIGEGDMLFSTPQLHKPKRIQGAFVSEDEIVRVVEHLKSQAAPDYHEEILHLKVAAIGGGVDTGGDDDPLVWEAADIVVTSGLGSTSMLQRRLKVGYARAGRIMDMLEAKGIVGPPDGSRPRDVIASVEELESIKAFERRDWDERGGHRSD